MDKITLIIKAKQRWRLMSLLKSLGRLRIKLSSSTPLVSCHLYCSCRLIRSLTLPGSNQWDIHYYASLLFILISSNLVVVDCKYICSKANLICQKHWRTEWPSCLNIDLTFARKIKTWNNIFLLPLLTSYTCYILIEN